MADVLSVALIFLFNAGYIFVGVYGAIYLWNWKPKSVSVVTGVSSVDDSLAVHCKACDMLISAKARRCPHCTTSL